MSETLILNILLFSNFFTFRVSDKKAAKTYNIRNFPALSLFRNGEPSHFEVEKLNNTWQLYTVCSTGGHYGHFVCEWNFYKYAADLQQGKSTSRACVIYFYETPCVVDYIGYCVRVILKHCDAGRIDVRFCHSRLPCVS